MKYKYIIKNTLDNSYFIGGDRDMGKPVFNNGGYPLQFSTEQEAERRILNEIDEWGPGIFEDCFLEIVKIISFKI